MNTDVEEDLRRLREFERTGESVPFEEVKAWVDSWGAENELPRPQTRRLGVAAHGQTEPLGLRSRARAR